MQYFGEMLKVGGIAIICVTLIMLTRSASGIALVVRVGGSVLIFGVFLSVLRENVEALEEVVSLSAGYGGSYVSKAFSLMLKALGIALLSKLCADVCRDCGEGTLASGVEGVGRMAIFSLCLPIISEIIEYAAKTLDMGM